MMLSHRHWLDLNWMETGINMEYICAKGKTGVCILRCFGYDEWIEIPEEIAGCAVTELGSYLFAEIRRSRECQSEDKLFRARLEDEAGRKWTWEECQKDLLFQDNLEEGTPAVRGNRLRAVSLPETLKKIGAYAFYHCENLEKVSLFCTVSDLGAGLFTGCYGIKNVDIWMVPGEKSCLKEVLAELHQTLWINIGDKEGKVFARLIFPEYFEESIENTPARILTQEMHGCGHRYRNAFSGTDFQYHVYDKLFPHIQVQENAALVTELALGRLMFPVQLHEERKKIYEEYVRLHGREVVQAAVKTEDMSILYFSGESKWCTRECLEDMLKEAGKLNNAQVTGILMDIRRKQFLEKTDSEKTVQDAGKQKRRFEW